MSVSTRKIAENIENALIPLIQFEGADQNHEAPARAGLRVLGALSWLYACGAQLRRWLFDRGILHRYPLGCQVISVGNITAGGTGKTPMVEALARDLQRKGRRVAILSRGYRKKEDSLGKRMSKQGIVRKIPRVVSDGNTVRIDSEQAGDEPYMLAKNLPGVAVLVGKDRVNSGRYAVRTFACDTLILDDGFQYQRLKHRLDLVLVDCGNPFGNDHVLPRGILREPLRNLRRARFICITKVHGRDTAALRERIRELNPNAGIMECDHVPRLLRDAFDDPMPKKGEKEEDARKRMERPLDALRGTRVYAVSGIASPRSFESSLEDFGAILVGRRHFADHHRYSKREINAILKDAAALGADMIVTTEKDAVRMPRPDDLPIPILYLRIEIRFNKGLEEFERCVGLITNARQEKTFRP